MAPKRNDKQKITKNELFISSHLMMILTYTIFSVILIIETFVMDWEKWAALLILAGVAISWYIHFSQIGDDILRLWICSILMMATFFFYGTHETSTFDLAVVICVVMFLYTMTGIHSLVTLCQVTYYLTLAYELYNLYTGGTVFDPLLVSRTLLHIAVVTMTGWIARTIIDKWQGVLDQSREEVTALSESASRLNDFIANVSHEIRTPINAILGICNMCLNDEEDPKTRNSLVSIEKAGKRIGEQISDILDYSEIDRKDLANNFEDFMLSSVLNDLVNELSVYHKSGLELIIDVDASIPSVMETDVAKLKKILWHLITNGIKFTNEGGVYVHISPIPHEYGINLCMEIRDTGIGMDEKQLEKIYDDFYRADTGRTRNTGGLGLGMIIVHGFVRSLGGFMTVESEPGEGTTVRVSIPCRVVDSESCMSVRDRDSISLGAYLHFEKYSNPHVREFYDTMVRNIVTGLKVTMHRVDNTESLRALTDSKKLTHLFAGPEEYLSASDLMEELARSIIVTVVADPGQIILPAGSKVRIMFKPFYCFPVVGVLNSKIGEAPEGEGTVTFPGARVLVVDDEPMNLIVSSQMLRRYGMNVTTCESGQSAIDLCRSNDYDVILMDHMMPGMDGVEAMKRIRADQTRGKVLVPIIAFTANAVSSAKEMFRQAGFDGFVGKPVDSVELERVLKRVLPASLIVLSDPVTAKRHITEADGADVRSAADRLAAIGVDTAKGLYYCQNDRNFYETLLAQYKKESVLKKKIMDESLLSGDLAAYAIQVHSIKSTSKMIGAMDLSEIARGLETAAKSSDRDYIDQNHETMITMYDRVLDAIGKDDEEPLTESAAVDDDDDILEFDPEGDDEEGGSL
ncbi:MAG: response regulator [Lachnospiraceae bacterium]|nr:response regulator [Lachnospiraceae bacterium]